VSEIKALNIGAIVLDPRLQPRVEMNQDLVETYARCMDHGDEFDPVTVFFDGMNYKLTSGWHRLHAHKLLGKASIRARIINGTFTEALWNSIGSNNKNGARLSIADKRRNVQVVLEHEDFGQLPLTELARQCDVSPAFVKKMRDELGVEAPDTIKIKTKTGKVVERKATTDNKKSKSKEQPKAEEPDEFEMAMEDAQTERIQQLEQENKNLSDRLAVAALDATDEEKKLAEQTIADLREEVRQLEIRLEAVTKSRDTFQGENAQMKRQIAMLQKQLKDK
jgi:hypothetical protein